MAETELPEIPPETPKEVLQEDCVDIVLLNEGVYAISNLLSTDLSIEQLRNCRGIGYKDNGNICLNEPEKIVPKSMLAKAEPSPLSPAQVEEWVSMSSEKNPTLRQSVIGLQVTELETQKAKAALKPTVDLQLSHTFNNNINGSAASTNGLTSNLTTGAVVLSWPFYTGNALDNRVRETLSLTQKAQADLDAASRTVAQNTRSAFFGVMSGVSQVKALQAAVESSQVALEANKLGYTVGVRINMNVLDAQSKLFDTKAKLAKARYDVLMGHLRLRQVSGTLQLQDLQGINNLLEP
jgi:outer membrane protein